MSFPASVQIGMAYLHSMAMLNRVQIITTMRLSIASPHCTLILQECYCRWLEGEGLTADRKMQVCGKAFRQTPTG